MLQRGAWPGRVGEKHDDAALLAEAPRCLNGGGEGPDPVMHHAPNIDEPGGVARAQLIDGAEHRDRFSADGHWLPLEAPRRRVKTRGYRAPKLAHFPVTGGLRRPE